MVVASDVIDPRFEFSYRQFPIPVNCIESLSEYTVASEQLITFESQYKDLGMPKWKNRQVFLFDSWLGKRTGTFVSTDFLILGMELFR